MKKSKKAVRIVSGLLVLMFILTSLSVAYADNGVVTFEDKNLESAIKEFLKEGNYDYYIETGILTKEVMEQIDTIVIQEDKGITSLVGLEQAKSLEVLWIQNNNIQDLSPLKGLTKLNSLTLSNNSIESINALKDLNELQTLYIDNNNITDIGALKELNKLETLVISNNNISDIRVLEGKTELKSFESYGNSGIEDISSLKDSLKLEFLIIVDSKIKDISVLEDKTNLKHLALIEGDIENIKSLENLRNLEVLLLTDNNIKDISPLLPFDIFDTINIDGNPLWKNDGTNSMLGEVTGEKVSKPIYEVWSEPQVSAVVEQDPMQETDIERNSALPIIVTTVGGLFIILFIVVNNKNLKIFAVENSDDTWAVRILGKRNIKVHSDEISIDISKELSEIEDDKLKVVFSGNLPLKLLDKKIIFIKDKDSFGEITLTELTNVIEVTKDGVITISKK
ncbi:leucine rich repeats-containing protein [Clostridium aceticum]|uniref:Leucine rich repeats-containing protein n=1 Tax=Clostridium aceticum TaxID=84022 RepID=A0A0G3WE43_9CLOT|nr:leucine-rich repeat domain-containing protein [Clostridium aceticum]AKL96187.1 leucine rich repeats-containing protein [Clostridium aceticum]